MSPLPDRARLPDRTLRLRDGRVYVLRQLGPDDAPRVAAMFATLSAATIHARYGYLIRDMTPEHAHRLVAGAPGHEVPLGLLERAPDGTERLWAMGRLVLAPGGDAAECAVLVHDDRRQLGIATRLVLHLRLVARRLGLRRVFAQVRRENRAMLAVFRRHGAQLHFDPAGDLVEVDVPFRRAKNSFDKPEPAATPPRMAAPAQKSFSPVALVIDLVLTAAFFAFIFSIIKSHVPSTDPAMIKLWGGLAAGCMSGVFWLALQMVKVVYRFQRTPRA